MNTAAIESEISAFLGKYAPAIEAELREARTRLRAMFSAPVLTTIVKSVSAKRPRRPPTAARN